MLPGHISLAKLPQMARTPNNGPSMSGTRPRFGFNKSSSGESDGSGMGMDMLDTLFPDSLWKHGSLTDPVDEETYQEKAKRKKRAQRDLWIKLQKEKTRRGLTASKLHPARRKLDKKRRDMVKLRQIRLKRLISEMPTAAELQRRRKKSALLKKNRLVTAKRMKTQALVKAREARLERLLSEIPSSASYHLRTKRSKSSRKRNPQLDRHRKLMIETRKWSRRIAKMRAQDAASLKHRSEVKLVRPVKKPAPKSPY